MGHDLWLFSLARLSLVSCPLSSAFLSPFLSPHQSSDQLSWEMDIPPLLCLVSLRVWNLGCRGAGMKGLEEMMGYSGRTEAGLTETTWNSILVLPTYDKCDLGKSLLAGPHFSHLLNEGLSEIPA